MKRKGFSSVHSLVNELLDRYEKNPEASRIAVPIEIDGFRNVAEQDAFDEDIAGLEHIGGLELKREGFGMERQVTGAKLHDPTLLYHYVNRTPSVKLTDTALSTLRSRKDFTKGARAFIEQAASAWIRGVSYLRIKRSDVCTLEQVIDLVAAIHARAQAGIIAYVDFRSFSRTAAADSKALECNLSQIAEALPRIYPDAYAAKPQDIETFLTSIGVKKFPQPFLVRGHIVLDGHSFPPLPYVGIPPECADRLSLVETPAYILTIENYASFVRHVREVSVSDTGLIIFSGGFPSRPTLAAILRLANQARVPAYHWGDMDAGGVRIFRHLEVELSAVGIALRPHMMDAALLRRVGNPAGWQTTDGWRSHGERCCGAW